MKVPRRMCFSATASFAAAAVTGVLGLMTLGRAHGQAQFVLAATPMIFAVQQAIEGTLWLALETGTGGAIVTNLTYAYLLFAEAWWPVFVPVAVLLVEPDEQRRRFIMLTLGVGLAVGAYLFWIVFSAQPRAAIIDDHLVYATGRPSAFIAQPAYLVATVAPLLLSSQCVLKALGLVVLVGAVTAYLLYAAAFVSVWCFFAAVASAVLVYHFARLKQAAPQQH
ncbi:MAG: hypothetical protein HY834_05905 [Devosia nanyangense]|uniref:Uncharacterized protein n=1 Tax=Devosia nanyangense TaxID=1228055 RepID=A0A933KZ42_9HYPH|nr:hypothetical protein [Devosia nanyangense]